MNLYEHKCSDKELFSGVSMKETTLNLKSF